MNRQGWAAIGLILTGVFFGGCQSLSVPVSDGGPVIRVAVARQVDETIIQPRGPYEVWDAEKEILLLEGRRRVRWQWRRDSDGFLVWNGRPVGARVVRVVSHRDDIAVSIGNRHRRYRGTIVIRADDKKGVWIINHIGLEKYINGILLHEISHRWPIEVMKAQAVAARSYALFQRSVSGARFYDVRDDIYSQVYGGRGSERYRVRLAVARTQGEVLTYQGRILPAYFHACCGGHTEDAAELWRHKDLAPLRGVFCGTCTMSPHYHWRRNFRSKDLQDALRDEGFDIGLIKTIRVIDRTRSGRARQMEIVDRAGKKIEISAHHLRQLLGPNNVKSTKFRVEMKGYFFDLVGQGWGHGVGMCQWGAYGMAKQRYSYRQILAHYYPDARIEKISAFLLGGT